MRMNSIPRALPTEYSIAEPVEVGSGMVDRRVEHAVAGPLHNNQVNNPQEREWFNKLEDRDPDPRNARSDYHDPTMNIMVDKKTKTSINDIELAEGYIDDAIMYPNGAHIKLIDGEDVYFIFAPDTNFIVKGTKIKIIDKVVITTLPYAIYPGSDELAQEETHSLVILEVLEGNIESDLNETIEEE